MSHPQTKFQWIIYYRLQTESYICNSCTHCVIVLHSTKYYLNKSLIFVKDILSHII
jgi:hypothetical protein